MSVSDSKKSEYSENIMDPENDSQKDPVTVSEKIPENETIDAIYSKCLELGQKYIYMLDDPEEIKTNNGLFVGMLKYIYRFYLIDLLGNTHNVNNRYDFKLLDRLFYIYTDLVYKYKHNKRATIIEFSIFVSISRDTLYNAALGLSKKLTPEETCMVKKWFNECENTLTNNSSVFDMFLLKSHPVYRYNDNLAPVPLTDQGRQLAINELPDLSCQNAISDKQTDVVKQDNANK